MPLIVDTTSRIVSSSGPNMPQAPMSSEGPISLVPEKAQLIQQLRNTVPAQYWGTSTSSTSTPDGALASSVSDPVSLPLLSGSGLSRPHLVLATQAIKLPGRPSLPGLPSVCLDQGGLVLDRVLAQGSGDSWWAVLTGRARMGRLAARRRDMLSAVADPSSYSLCATARTRLGRTTVLRSRLDWSPPLQPTQAPAAAGCGTASSGGKGSRAAASAAAHQGRGGWAAPLSLSCQLRSRVGPGTEARADLAVRQRAAVSSRRPWSSPLASSAAVDIDELGAEADERNGNGDFAEERRQGSVRQRRSWAAPAAAEPTTPLLLGLQAGTAATSRAPLVWRCGVLQVTAPPTLGHPSDASGPTLQSAVYVQGTAAVQGERYLWRGPKKPQRRQTGLGNATTMTAVPLASAAAPPPPAPPPTAAPGLGPHNPVRQAANYVLNRIGGGRGEGTDGDEEDDDGGGGGRGSGNGAATAARPPPLRGSGGTAATGVAAGGGGSSINRGAPFGVELPPASSVQEALMDATQSISRLRDDVTQATRWVGEGGLAEQLSTSCGAASGGAGGAAGGGGARGQQSPPGPRGPWSSFVGEPHVKVAGIAGITARAPVIMLTHGSPAHTADSKRHAVNTSTATELRGNHDLGQGRTGNRKTRGSLLPLRLAWVHDLGLRKPLRRLLGRGGGGEGPSASTSSGFASSGSSINTGEAAGARRAAAAASSSLSWVSRGSVRPFASAAASLQAGRFTGWFLDYTRLNCQLDCGLWGPADGATPDASPGVMSMTARPQRHPAFALGDTGAWHALTVSLSQQLLGPLRLAADWRYRLASARPLAFPPPPPLQAATGVATPPRSGGGGAAAGASGAAALAAAAAAAAAGSSWLPGAAGALCGHVAGMRPQLAEAVYALDLAVPGTAGATRVVAWYAPQRREGMVEVRLF